MWRKVIVFIICLCLLIVVFNIVICIFIGSIRTFYGEIIAINGESILVNGVSINDINHRGRVRFTLGQYTILRWHNRDLLFEELEEGDIISITYASQITESDPARINNIVKIELLDDEK